MSSNYTGNPAGVQSPSPTPDAGSPPIVTLPADGDALIAASVAQMAKVPADALAFFQAPFANPSAWGQPVMPFRDAKLNRRFVVDHFGLPRGSYSGWVEDWTPSGTFSQGGSAGTFAAGRWSVVMALGGSGATPQSVSVSPATVYPSPPLPALFGSFTSVNAHRSLAMSFGADVGSRSEVRLADGNVTSTFADDTLLSLEADVTLESTIFADWVPLGFTTTNELVNGINDGAYFYRDNGSPSNFHCRTIVGGVQTDVDSGVASTTNVRHNFRIVLVGATADDASTARALFFIDGAEVSGGGITTHLPVNLGLAMIPIFGGTNTSATSTAGLIVGPVRYSQITALSTP